MPKYEVYPRESIGFTYQFVMRVNYGDDLEEHKSDFLRKATKRVEEFLSNIEFKEERDA